MAIKDWPGGVISKTPVVPAGPYAGSAASGVWTLDQVAYWNKQGTWPGLIPGDPYFYDVSLLLTGDGTNGAQNNTFLDSSTNNFTITRNGNTTQGTFSPYGNLWSFYSGVEGNGDVIYVANNTITNFGTGDFTVECWINQQGTAESYFINSNNGTGLGCLLSVNGGGVGHLRWFNGNSVMIDYNAGFQLGVWYHLAVCRSGTTTKMFINGSQVASISDPYNYQVGGNTSIGGSADSSWCNKMYISNVRIVKGVALYTSAFSPSSAPLTAVTGTSLLACQSNRFKDNSSNNYTFITVNSPKINRFSPFNPPVPYSASTIGGSGYFDGTGDYLKIADNAAVQLGTSQFWYEAWIYVTTLPTTGSYIVLGGTTNGAMTVRIRAAALRVDLLNVGSWDSTSVTWQKGAWQHIAVGRDSGNTLRFFVNGEAKGTATLTNSCDGYSNSLGVNPSELAEYFPGYLCDSRLIKGSCLYTTSFTPPTTPVTAVTNTSWLCNFTNAGIPDAAMMNDLETVGNARVSTSVKKYGTGSLYFDGTGDWLVAPASPNLAYDNGNFTVEFWVYVNAYTGTGAPLITSTSAQNIDLHSDGAFGYYNGADLRTAAGAMPLTTWTHVAVVRSGTTVTIYKNGVNIASTTMSTTNPGSPSISIGGTSGYTNNCYIDDLRITKGYARYTSNFTPPTAAFPTY